MSGRGAMFQDGRVVVEEDDSQQRISALTAEVERLKAENGRLNKIIDKMIKVK